MLKPPLRDGQVRVPTVGGKGISLATGFRRALAASSTHVLILAHQPSHAPDGRGLRERGRHVCVCQLPPPYRWLVANLDPGMTRGEAEALARLVTEATHCEPQVVPDGHWFAVTVRSSGVTWCPYDEADWPWLRGQIIDGA